MLNDAKNTEKMSIRELILYSDIVNQSQKQIMDWFPGIQEFRGLLITLIVLSHASDFPFVNSKSVWGAAGVTGFFMIAGFLCPERMQTTEGGIHCGIANVTRTIKKIYFPYIVCLLGSIFVNPGKLTDFIKCAFLSQSYWGNTSTAISFNGNTWFLSSILLSYLMAPMLQKKIMLRNLRYSILCLLGLIIFQFLYGILWCNWNFESGYYWFYIFPVYRVVDFAEGILVRNIFNQRHKRLDDLRGLIYIISIILFVVILIIIQRFPRPLQYDAAWVPIMAVMLVCYALQGHFIIYPLGKLGGVSMEIFLSHRLVMLVILRYGNDVIAFLTFVIVALCVAILLFYLQKKLGDKNVSRRYKML